jgi:PIN domain nuclease of toxin-antitoxin system
MRLLLDTHIFLWYITGDPKLPVAIAESIRQKSNEVFLSVVSVWEILVKHQRGNLPLPVPADEYIRGRRERHQIGSLALDEDSIAHLLRLPSHHRDPFDRMLICQAMQHDCVMVTFDEAFDRYPVKLLPLS